MCFTISANAVGFFYLVYLVGTFLFFLNPIKEYVILQFISKLEKSPNLEIHVFPETNTSQRLEKNTFVGLFRITFFKLKCNELD